MKRRTIVAAIPTNGTDGRLRVNGLLRYANTRTNWDLRVFSTSTGFNDNAVRALLAGGIDGCILATYTPAVESMLERRTPVVLVMESLHERLGIRPNCLSVLMDNTEIGRVAAKHFKALGRFASYAFVSTRTRTPWSIERRDAFFANADEKAICIEYPERGCETPGMAAASESPLRTEDLADFLKSLPLPVAVFAANDNLAVMAVDACRKACLNVPSKVAILGCDNDDILCRLRRPLLSSILPNFEQAGFVAARALDAMMRGKRPKNCEMRISGSMIAQRESTEYLPPALSVVNRAMEYIAAHALEGISTSDVVSHLGISESLLDLRFRQIRGESVMSTIIGIRLAAVRTRLETTSEKISAIGAACGFRSADYLKRIFKSRFGMSMREWRRR